MFPSDLSFIGKAYYFFCFFCLFCIPVQGFANKYLFKFEKEDF